MNTKILLLSLAMGLCACKKTEDTVDPSKVATADSGAVTEDASQDPEKGNIAIDEELANMCALPEANFDYDSTKLSPAAQQVLDALAQCFIDGPAKNERMSLVGHADPRGDEEYNMGLGQRRAGSVAKYLTGRGLSDDRIESSSRGELDAVGTDEAGWAKDRRVDISLAK